MEKLSTIQKTRKLNDVYSMDEPGAGNAYHVYGIVPSGSDPRTNSLATILRFQHGPRFGKGSTTGILDEDLLEIVRDRLKDFQSGEYATPENAHALTHIEEALLWMNKRKEDRAERGVLGTMEK